MQSLDKYDEQAQKFLDETQTTFKAEFKEHGLHFEDDKEKRDIYTITLKRGDREYKFKFGQSLINSGFHLFRHDGAELRVKSTSRDLKKVKADLALQYGNVTGMKITEPQAPRAYDVLACLTKYHPGSFKDFCGEYGYDEDSRKAERTYKAVLDEFTNLERLYSDEELRKLQEVV